ncbi:MAG TPA: hypothetical protein VIH90_04215 [Candidatus Saccharimonadales bacterium]
MAEITAVVPREGIKDTGLVGFQFLIDVDVPPADVISKPFGILSRHKKSDNYTDLFRLARGEPGAIGDDGVLRWGLSLFARGQMVHLDGVDDPGLEQLLLDAPDCNVLVPPEDIEPIELACSSLGHNLTVIRHQGILATS